MPIQHTNRCGQVYYLYQGTTKTGKPKYFFSIKIKEERLGVIPTGFEVYESPTAQVFLIKKEPPLITELEKQTVISAIKKNKDLEYFLVDVRKKYITIYLAKPEPLFEKDPLITQLMRVVDAQQFLNYMEKMRFELIDVDKRHFIAERFCYRGAVDDWMQISAAKQLNKLVEFVKHLGKDSYYELFSY